MDKANVAQRGRGAKALKETLNDAFLCLEQAYQEQIVESAFEEVELREHIYHRIRLIRDLSEILTKIVADGEIAHADIIRMAKINAGEVKEFF